MNLIATLKTTIEKRLRVLFATAFAFIFFGMLLLIGQNILISFFMDRNALSLISDNYTMSFKMAYAPLLHFTKTEEIISKINLSEQQQEHLFQLFGDSTYIKNVQLIEANELNITIDEREIYWKELALVEDKPYLVTYYNPHDFTQNRYLQIKVPLKELALRESPIIGYAVIKDSDKNAVVTVLNELQWKTYNIAEAEAVLNNAKSQDTSSADYARNQNIAGREFGILKTSFELDGQFYYIDYYFDTQTVSRNIQIILLTLIILFSFFGLGLFLLILFLRPERIKLSAAERIKQLITLGESEKLEFKSSLRWDYNNGVVNKDLERVIIKSIAAFSNASGGQLLIGVRDDGAILGLEKDYATLKTPNADYFELHVRNLIAKEFGQDFCARQITCTFYSITENNEEEKQVVAINIKKGDDPVYVQTENKGESFFVRSGNSSRKIENLSELLRYSKKRF